MLCFKVLFVKKFVDKENLKLIVNKVLSIFDFIGVGSKILLVNKFKIFVDWIKCFLRLMNI